jgi:hypothetical protein
MLNVVHYVTWHLFNKLVDALDIVKLSPAGPVDVSLQ